MAMMEKASNSDADVVFLDCEDAVVPADKPEARKKTIEALKNFGWREKGITVCVRINSLDTHFMYRDVVDIVEQAGQYLDTILIPKVGKAADVYMVDCMLTQIEDAMDFGDHKIGIEALIETTLGMANVEEIAQSSPRLEALHFGRRHRVQVGAHRVQLGEPVEGEEQHQDRGEEERPYQPFLREHRAEHRRAVVPARRTP